MIVPEISRPRSVLSVWPSVTLTLHYVVSKDRVWGDAEQSSEIMAKKVNLLSPFEKIRFNHLSSPK